MTNYYNIEAIEKKLNLSSYYGYVLASKFFERKIDANSQDLLSVVQRDTLRIIENMQRTENTTLPQLVNS